MTFELCIGRIVSIRYGEVIVETLSTIGDYVCIKDGVRFVGELGSYLSIKDVGRKIIAEIVSIDEKDNTSNEQISKAESDRYLKLSPVGEIIGELFTFGITKMPAMFSEVNLISEKDLQIMMDVSNSDIKSNDMTKLTALSIGKSVMFPQYDVKVKLNDFFGFHFAVFGNTGSGKSNTIAQIIQTIFSKKDLSACGAKFIIFDSNGEYEEAFENISNTNAEIITKKLTADRKDNCDVLKIPVWALSVDDWAVLLRASEKTQIPVISRALELIKLFNNDKENSGHKESIKDHIIAIAIRGILSSADGSAAKSDKLNAMFVNFESSNFSLNTKVKIDKLLDPSVIRNNEAIDYELISKMISVDYGKLFAPNNLISYCSNYIIKDFNKYFKNYCEPIPYSLDEFIEAIELAILYEGSITSNKIFEYTASLKTRITHLSQSDYGSFLDKTKFTTIENYIASIIGDNQLLNIDISALDDTATEVVTKVFTKMLFDYMRKLEPRNSVSINLILEEAHRFIRVDDEYNVLGYNIFERVAREGRKYGLHMGISSQRPSELSKTVVSQCNNFIIHRMQNPDDLQYVSRMIPYINKNMIDRISYLPRGNALVFGTAINLPMLTKFRLADPTPNSSNSNIVDIWYISSNSDNYVT